MNVTLTPTVPQPVTTHDILVNGCSIGEVEALTPDKTYNGEGYRAIIRIINKDNVYLTQLFGRGGDVESAIIAALANGERDAHETLSEIERLRGLL